MGGTDTDTDTAADTNVSQWGVCADDDDTCI